MQEIAAYCESDVVNTYRVWLRYELLRAIVTGRVSGERGVAGSRSDSSLQEPKTKARTSVRAVLPSTLP
jgi:hypothetical protein